MFLSSKNMFRETSGIIFDQIPGYHGLAKFTHEVNHYSALNWTDLHRERLTCANFSHFPMVAKLPCDRTGPLPCAWGSLIVPRTLVLWCRVWGWHHGCARCAVNHTGLCAENHSVLVLMFCIWHLEVPTFEQRAHIFTLNWAATIM